MHSTNTYYHFVWLSYQEIPLNHNDKKSNWSIKHGIALGNLTSIIQSEWNNYKANQLFNVHEIKNSIHITRQKIKLFIFFVRLWNFIPLLPITNTIQRLQTSSKTLIISNFGSCHKSLYNWRVLRVLKIISVT